MNLKKTVRTQAEKDALLAAARVEWDKLGELQPMVARSEEEYLSKISDSIIIEREPFTPARELTTTETAELNGRLMFSQLYGDRAESSATGVAAIDDLVAEQERAALEKLIGPARRAESALESMVRSIVVKTIGNHSVPRRESEREGIIPRLAAAASEENANSPLARFLTSYVKGDRAGMKSVAKELAAA